MAPNPIALGVTNRSGTLEFVRYGVLTIVCLATRDRCWVCTDFGVMLVHWWHGSDLWLPFLCKGARFNLLLTWQLPISRRQRREIYVNVPVSRRLLISHCRGCEIYVFNVPEAQRRLPGTLTGAHRAFACLHGRVDHVRCVQALQFVSVLAHM